MRCNESRFPFPHPFSCTMYHHVFLHLPLYPTRRYAVDSNPAGPDQMTALLSYSAFLPRHHPPAICLFGITTLYVPFKSSTPSGRGRHTFFRIRSWLDRRERCYGQTFQPPVEAFQFTYYTNQDTISPNRIVLNPSLNC